MSNWKQKLKHNNVTDLYAKNYKTLMKKVKRKKKGLNKWREKLCSLIERPNIVKMAIIPKLIYQSLSEIFL